MACYAALVSLAQTIEKILNQELPLAEKQQIIYVHEYITFLQAFLENFPDRAKILEKQIRDLASEAEDKVDNFLWRRDLFMSMKRRLNGANTKIQLHFDVEELQRMLEGFSTIAGEAMVIKRSNQHQNRSTDSSPHVSPSRTASTISKDVTLGVDGDLISIEELNLQIMRSSDSSADFTPSRTAPTITIDDDLMTIKERLCGESLHLQIIPIVGMGGIGKTTLARNVYDDPLIQETFQIRAWVVVSQDYSTQAILSSLQVSLKASSEEEVYKTLKGRKYLIVMDDMWSTDAWDDVQRLLPDDEKGSRVMLTTRLSEVAAYPDSCSSLHHMHFMDADQSWDLLLQKVFNGGNCPPELETIGKTIARSCRGLPLAIVLIAGLLSTVTVGQTKEYWESVAEQVNQVVTKNNEKFASVVLSLNYNHLPQHLRPCFLYMGAFPEDHVIYVTKLIKLWVAEDFPKPSESKSPEAVAEDYLEELIKRSLVFVIERKSNGKIKSCSIHDLVRDLCLRKAEEEKFLHRYLGNKHYQQKSPREAYQRRLSLVHCDSNDLNICSAIRAIICFQCSGNWLASLGNFRLLRILDMVNNVNLFLIHEEFMVLPKEVFQLFHLRYLAFEYPINIATDIINLQNLQTLIIHPRQRFSYGPCMVYLPLEIWSMPQLRHLISFVLAPLPYPQGAILGLENLQTHFEDEFVEDYQLQNLVHLHHLEKLKLRIFSGFRYRKRLNNPVFPKSLQKLTLSGLKLPWNKMTIVGKLPDLEVLKLRYHACEGDEWETRDEEFPRLKFLVIDVSSLRRWITDSSHFRCLKFVALYRCRYLAEIPEEIGDFPALEMIALDKNNKSLVASGMNIQKEQEDQGNNVLQVRSIDCDVWKWDNN